MMHKASFSYLGSNEVVLAFAFVFLVALQFGCTDQNAEIQTETIVVHDTYREPWVFESTKPQTWIVTDILDDAYDNPEPRQYQTEAPPGSPRVLRERRQVLKVPVTGPLEFEVVDSEVTIYAAFLPESPDGNFDANDHWVCGYVSKNPTAPPPFNPGNIDFSDLHSSGIPNDCIDLGYCPMFTSCEDSDGGSGSGGGPGGRPGPGNGSGSDGGGGLTPNPCPPTDFESCLFCCTDKAKEHYPDNASESCRRWIAETVFDICWKRCKRNSKDEPKWGAGKFDDCNDRAANTDPEQP